MFVCLTAVHGTQLLHCKQSNSLAAARGDTGEPLSIVCLPVFCPVDRTTKALISCQGYRCTAQLT
jgi:hypothetical protein